MQSEMYRRDCTLQTIFYFTFPMRRLVSLVFGISQKGGSKEASLDLCVQSEAEGLVNKTHKTTNHNNFWSVLGHLFYFSAEL